VPEDTTVFVRENKILYVTIQAPNRTVTSCQEQGTHILRGFSMGGPPEYRIKSRAVDDLALHI